MFLFLCHCYVLYLPGFKALAQGPSVMCAPLWHRLDSDSRFVMAAVAITQSYTSPSVADKKGQTQMQNGGMTAIPHRNSATFQDIMIIILAEECGFSSLLGISYCTVDTMANFEALISTIFFSPQY